MKLDIFLSESDTKIDAEFKETHEVSGGGFSEGYDQGHADGYIKGHADGEAEGYTEGYTEGKKSEYDHFWDNFQDYGNKSNYLYAFGSATWTKEIFKPKYDIKPTSEAEGMFQNSDINVDLVEYLNALGVELDLSKATSLSKAFQKTEFTRLGLIDVTNLTTCTQLFNASEYLVTIDTLKCKFTNTWSNAFNGCYELVNITIEGEIGKAIAFSGCEKLSHDSLMSIINHLRKLTSTLTLTLGSTNLAKLTDDEKAIATGKGWTLA